MAERITVYKLAELAADVAQRCDIPLESGTKNKKSTLSIAGYRAGAPVREILYTGSVREAYAFLLGMAMIVGVNVERI